MTLEKASSDTEIFFLPREGIEPGTSSTRGKCITTDMTELPKIVNEYDQEIPRSQTADNPVAP